MRRACVAVILSACLASRGAYASGPEVERCAAAAEEGQAERDKNHLLAARRSFLLCAAESCPPVVQKDCAAWVADVDRNTPSIVVRARDDRGRDITDVRVVVDGVTVLEQLNGSAVPVDPGPHAIRYEGPSGSREERILVAIGEKNRVLAVELQGSSVPSAPAPETSVTGPPSSAPRRPPTLAFVAGGVSLLAFGSFAYFELRGQHDYRQLRDGCAGTHSCAQSDVDDVRTKFVAAGISLAVGIVALAVGTWLTLWPPTKGSTAVAGTF
jgi:hypothetical protein